MHYQKQTNKGSHGAFAATLIAICAASAVFSAPNAMAAGNDGMGIYLQGGHSIAHGNETDNVFIGLQIPKGESTPVWFGMNRTTFWDVYYGQWRGPYSNGVEKTYNQVGGLLVARFRPNGGSSRWFYDAGIGLSYLDDIYKKPNPNRTFGSRLNFTERLGVGYSFGAQDQHEVSLNYQHHSNAGLKKPNPGEDFVQVRYAYKF